MNLQTFFDNFELLAEAPNGVQKLRELILQLAVRGKLVEQDDNDEPASVLLEKIQAEKNKLINEGKIKEADSLPPVIDSNIPYNLPLTWAWVRLGEVVEYNRATKVSPNHIPPDSWLLELEDIEKDSSKIIQRFTFKERQSKSTKAKFNKEDVLYGKLRPYLNKVIVADCDGFCTTEIVPLRSYFGIFPKYLMYALKTPDFLEYVNSKTYGVKMPRLGTEDGRRSPFPLPPLAEQHRIVTKVDQLIKLCDELEARQQKKQEAHVSINNTAIAQLLIAREPEEFNKSWQRIYNNFDLLYSTPENIGKLRSCILQLAVMGKLAPQDARDESASVLLEKIVFERELLFNKGKISKVKPLMPIKAEEVPFTAPSGWLWERFGNIADIIGGVTKGRNLVGKETAFYPYLRVANVQRGFLNLEVIKEIEIPIEELEKYCLQVGDILLTEGGDWDKLGRSAIWTGDIQDCIHQNHIFRARPLNTVFMSEWAVLFTNSPIGREYFETASKKTTNLASININQLRNCPFPIPPSNEQHRIITKVKKLMTLCDQVEAQLKQSVAKSEKLMETAVRQLLDINTIAADDICVEPTTLETKTVKQSSKKTQLHSGEPVQLNLPLF